MFEFSMNGNALSFVKGIDVYPRFISNDQISSLSIRFYEHDKCDLRSSLFTFPNSAFSTLKTNLKPTKAKFGIIGKVYQVCYSIIFLNVSKFVRLNPNILEIRCEADSTIQGEYIVYWFVQNLELCRQEMLNAFAVFVMALSQVGWNEMIAIQTAKIEMLQIHVSHLLPIASKELSEEDTDIRFCNFAIFSLDLADSSLQYVGEAPGLLYILTTMISRLSFYLERGNSRPSYQMFPR